MILFIIINIIDKELKGETCEESITHTGTHTHDKGGGVFNSPWTTAQFWIPT